MQLTICRKNKYGYCKYGHKCHFRHNIQICNINKCDIPSCEKRHPRDCRWFQEYGRCKFTSYCKYKHANIDSIEEIIHKIKENKDKLIEIDKILDGIEKKEINILEKLEVYEVQNEKRMSDLDVKLTTILKSLKEKDAKIVALENSLKETQDILERLKVPINYR